ncbi:hypothetical protein MYX75_12850 [Acidobacteria bacterium AH-259-A15]|nr:hypothetical protein [Acidobacteria bacterium AH-259-A15]
MPKGQPRIQVICSRCQATLVVDPQTGLVLHSEEKKSGYSFEEAVKEVKSRKEKSEELFQKAFVDEKRRQLSLEEKFREALESQDELDEPSHPLGID